MPLNDSYPERVQCNGDGLKFGYTKLPSFITIDTKRAGPGLLKVFCNGPVMDAFCELRDHLDGTFALKVRPHDVGEHQLHIQYDDVDVPGSPFRPRISPASLVRLQGAGMKHGVLSADKGRFTVDTHDAGPGDVKVRIGGPKGSFKMETEREGQVVHCNYNPREAALYVVHVTWQSDELPGSPFQVYAAGSEQDLQNFLATQSDA